MYQTSKTFKHVHDVCVDSKENVYALHWNTRGAYPIKLERLSSPARRRSVAEAESASPPFSPRRVAPRRTTGQGKGNR